ncbi:hypothetical protein CNMCM5623_006309 [Aspergillus felis]|uniref:Uncharacterized protein n=1 Tax=Aspergillus felis TaxID=1287682 RepID=A0A8H6PV15_9EURO|nr:hypothetical protein CNMCM5623_006309 [Aspergillus felis]KAF7179811.1 hypothetical protein CNMCM7691_008862 [Aspergillus felis]
MTAPTSEVDTVNFTEMPADIQATLKGYLTLGEVAAWSSFRRRSSTMTSKALEGGPGQDGRASIPPHCPLLGEQRLRLFARDWQRHVLKWEPPKGLKWLEKVLKRLWTGRWQSSNGRDAPAVGRSPESQRRRCRKSSRTWRHRGPRRAWSSRPDNFDPRIPADEPA